MFLTKPPILDMKIFAREMPEKYESIPYQGQQGSLRSTISSSAATGIDSVVDSLSLSPPDAMQPGGVRLVCEALY